MDEHDQARQALSEMFRRERAQREEAEAKARATQRRRGFPGGRRLILPLIVLGVLIVIGAPLVLVGVTFADRFSIITTIRQFCHAEAAGDYARAYSMLSRRAREQLSVENFATASQKARIVTCDSADGALRIQVSGDQATPDVLYVVMNAAGSKSEQEVGTMTLVRQDGGWKVDGTSSELFQLL